MEKEDLIYSKKKWTLIYEILLAFFMFLNLLIIIVDLIIIIINYEIDEKLNLAKNIMSVISNILLSLFGILLSMNSTNTKKLNSNILTPKKSLQRVFEIFADIIEPSKAFATTTGLTHTTEDSERTLATVVSLVPNWHQEVGAKCAPEMVTDTPPLMGPSLGFNEYTRGGS